MNFTEIAELRQSCRSYDPTREVESEEIADIPLPLGRLRPKEGGFLYPENHQLVVQKRLLPLSNPAAAEGSLV